MPVVRILCLDLEAFNQDPHVVKAINKLRSPIIRGEKMNEAIFNVRINKPHRLLFTIEDNKEGESGITFILLEIVPNHDYQKASFLKDPSVLQAFLKKNRKKLVPFEDENTPLEAAVEEINQNMLVAGDDPRFIQWDAEQQQGIHEHRTMLLTGVAGSGKTAVHFERMQETLSQMDPLDVRPILYVAEPVPLVRRMSAMWSELCSDFANDPRVLFLTFDELLHHLNLVTGKRKVDRDFFVVWYHRRASQPSIALDVYEEFRLISVYAHQGNTLSVEDYCACGDKHSLFPLQERRAYFELYEQYQRHLEAHNAYDPGFFDALPRSVFFRVFVDEAMLLTLGQWHSLERLAAERGNCFATDSLQALLDRRSRRGLFVHLYPKLWDQEMAIVSLSSHYRCPSNVVEFLTKVIDLRKNVLKGLCIDRFEPTHIESGTFVHAHPGSVQWMASRSEASRQLAHEISLGKSERASATIVIVLREEDKPNAQKVFNTASIFTVEESVGLSFPHVILFELFNHEGMKQVQKALSGSGSMTDREREWLRIPLNTLFVAASRSSGSLWLYGDMKHVLVTIKDWFLQRMSATASATATIPTKTTMASEAQWLQTISLFLKNGNERQAQDTWQQHFPGKSYEAFRETILPMTPKMAVTVPKSKVLFVSTEKLTKSFSRYLDVWFKQAHWLTDLEAFSMTRLSSSGNSIRCSLLEWILTHSENHMIFIEYLEQDERAENSRGLLISLLTSFREENTHNTALHEAIQSNCFVFIDLAFDKLMTLTRLNKVGRSALDFAISHSSTALIYSLILKGVALGDYTIKDNRVLLLQPSPVLFSLGISSLAATHDTTLWPEYIFYQHDEIILNKTKKMKSIQEHRNVFLMATQYGFDKTVRYLLTKGLDPFFRNETGLSAAYLAVQYGHVDILILFLRLYEHRITPPPGGLNPVEWAAYYGNDMIFDLLLSAPKGLEYFCPQLHSLDSNALEPIGKLLSKPCLVGSHAVRQKLEAIMTIYAQIVSYYKIERTRECKQALIDKIERTRECKQALIDMLKKHNDVFFYFMNSGMFNLEPLDDSFMVDRHRLHQSDIGEIVDVYLDSIAHYTDIDCFKLSSLVQGCLERNERLMLRYCFSNDVPGTRILFNEYAQTPLLGVVKNQDRSILDYYLDVLIKDNLTEQAEFFKALHTPFFISEGECVYQTTLLHVLIEKSKVPALCYSLIKHLSTLSSSEGTWLSYQETRYGRTPLMIATSLNLTLLVGVLLKKMVLKDAYLLRDYNGFHVLGLAIVFACHDIAKNLMTTYSFLIEEIMHCTAPLGEMTPLMLAAYHGNQSMVSDLLMHDNHPYVCNEDGKTALQFAVEQKQVEVVNVFKAHSSFSMNWTSVSFFHPKDFSAEDIEADALRHEC